jgi:hypothetical protein
MAEHVQQIAGGKIEGLEHCPPMYHFDFSTNEEFEEFLQNPEPTLEQLGVPAPKNLAIDLVRWDESYSETEGWEDRAMRGACCVASDGGVHCHRH